MKSVFFATLIASATAAPLDKRILRCTSFCGKNEPVTVTAQNAKAVATACLQNNTFASMTEVSHHFYLDSVAGSCTPTVYKQVQAVLDSLKLVGTETGKCTAQCSGAPTTVSLAAAEKCLSYVSAPFIPVNDWDEKYKLDADFYVLSGKCAFKDLNEREAAIRRKINGN